MNLEPRMASREGFEPHEFCATAPAIGETALGLEFVSALLPAMNAAGRDRLRWGVLTDLAAVEISRTKAVGTADEMLRSDAAIERSSADHLALVSDVVSARRASADHHYPTRARRRMRAP